MSYKASTASRERRIKRSCARLGLHLMTAQKPDRQVAAHGGYMLRDAETMTIVLGDQGYLFSSDLDEVEAYLDSLT
jgi:hypothetical protein